MSYRVCLEGVVAAVSRVPGLPGGVLDYEPAAVQQAPMVYCLLDGFRQTIHGGIIATEYDIMVRALVDWVDRPQAEHDLIPLVDLIPEAITADPYLGGRLAAEGVGGIARISPQKEAVAGFVKINGVVKRSLDTFVSVLYKKAAPPIAPHT